MDIFVARDDFLASQLASLNYAKYGMELGKYGVVKAYGPEIMFCDEAHELSDVVCDSVGLSLTWKNYSFLDPVEIKMEWGKDVAIMMAEEALDDFLISTPTIKITKYSSKKDIRLWRKCERLKQNIERVQRNLDQDFWYVRSDDDGFTIKPLTARYDFTRIFNAPKVVLMSATIGNIEVFTEELGIPKVLV